MVEADNIDMAGDGEEDEEGKEEQKKWDHLNEEKITKCEETFKVFQKDDSGMMEVESLPAFLQWLGFNPTEEEIVNFVKKYDPNASGHLAYEDCLKMADQKFGEPDTIDEFIEACKIFDSDADGKIEVNELRWAMQTLGGKDRMKESLMKTQ